MNLYSLRLFLFACILLPFLISTTPLSQENLPAIIKKIQPSVVLIQTYDKNGNPINLGTGFFISKDGEFITNQHVLEGASKAEIKTKDGRIYPVTKIIAEDKEGDLIKASIDHLPETIFALPLSSSLPEVGERIIIVGNLLGLEQTVSDGIVSAVREIPTFGNIIQVTAPISQGSSGSPVINMKGEVIGVATLLMLEGQNLNFAIPSERLLTFPWKESVVFAEWASINSKKLAVLAESSYLLGRDFIRIENYETAISHFEDAIKKNPEYADAYLALGYCKGELGHHEEEIEAYKQAIRIRPNYTEAYFNIGVAYMKVGRYQEAIESYKQAILIKPDFEEAYHNLGLTYGMVGRYQKEIEAYKQAILIKPDNAKVYESLGGVYWLTGRYKEAIESYKQAILIKPDFNAYYWLGVTYGTMYRYKEGIEALKQAIRIKPDNVDAHYLLGTYYFCHAERRRAFEEYEILKNLDMNKANKLLNLINK